MTMVTVKADRAGLQLAKFGDVRLHGVLVGQVRGVSQDGDEAEKCSGLWPTQEPTKCETTGHETYPHFSTVTPRLYGRR